MRGILLVLLVLAILPLPTFAIGPEYSIEDLVPQSDLIVVGRLKGVSEFSSDGVDYGRGRIDVSEVIWGIAAPGESLDLRWQNESSLMCSRVDHRDAVGTDGIWLLTRSSDGTVRADEEARFVALDRRSEVARSLARHPICIRSATYHDATKSPRVTVVFRNPGSQGRTFPGVEFRNGMLLVSPGVDVRLIRMHYPNPEVVAWRPNRVRVTNDLAPIVVAPQTERRIEVDLGALANIGLDTAYVFSLKTRATANPASVTVFARDPEPKSARAEAGTLTCGTVIGSRRLAGSTPWVFPLYEGVLVATVAFATAVHRSRRKGLPTETVLRRAAFQGLVVGTGGIAVMLLAEFLVWTFYMTR